MLMLFLHRLSTNTDLKLEDPNFNNFQLLQENEDIGKMISSGRLAKLEGELSMQKNLCEEMKKNQAEMDDFVQVHAKHDRN